MQLRSRFLALAVLLALFVGLSLAEVPAEGHIPSHNPLSGPNMSKLLRNATAGDAEAQFLLGRAYETGNGAPQDYSEAGQWYLRAANRGRPEAENNLGSLYREGKGVPASDVEAIKWFQRAAEQEFPAAQANLGVMYLHGLGVPPDPATAYMWLVLAGNAGKHVLSTLQLPLEK